MNYLEKLRTARIVEVSGKIFIPESYKGERNIIIPDEIVSFCAKNYGLLQEGVSTIDPMCGVGTIPRVINALNGNCRGVEIDEERFKVAKSVSPEGKIIHDDILKLDSNEKYGCIFTSLPFVWFKDKETSSSLSPEYARKFRELLLPNGFVLIDCFPEVEREGSTWKVGEFVSTYFQKNGFVLTETTVFENNVHLDSNSKSLVLKFIKGN